MASSSNSSTTATPPPRPVPVSLLVGSRYNDEMFWKGLRTSAGAHAALAVVLLIGSLLFTREPKKFVPAIRVDLVALPDVKKGDLSKLQPNNFEDLNSKLDKASKSAKKAMEELKKTPPPEPKPAPDEMMALKKEKAALPQEKPKKSHEDLKSAIDRIKALAAMEGDDQKTAPAKKVTYKGNQLSKGNSLTGEVSQSGDEYLNKLTSKVRDNWNLPVWLSKQNFEAAIVVFLDRQGYVSHTMVAKSSGNKQFDDYCLKTIRSSQPFGPPPDDVLQDGITLGFPL